MMYPLLHETLNVGSLVLKNRLVLPPMATEKSAKGQVTDGLVAYYGDMARSGPGLIIQEHSFVSPEGRASANQVSLAADADIPGLQRLTAAVHAQGVPILAQISAMPAVLPIGPLRGRKSSVPVPFPIRRGPLRSRASRNFPGK